MREKRKTLDKKEENLKFKKLAKKQKLQERGITLIALVVTIIILLILAGVTLNIALSDNGLFGKTKKAVKDYEAASESEAMSIYMLSGQLDEKENRLGKELADKTVENGNKWNIVVDKINNKTYGTGWNYVEKGTELEGYGEIENSWLINYETGEIIQLEEGNYDSITIDDTLKVKEDLIINVDSAMVDKGITNNQESIEKALGTGVKLHNFDFKNDGIVGNEFVLDGENDFITVDYNEVVTNGNDAEWFKNGFTIEFYGKMDVGSIKGYGTENFGLNYNKKNGWSGIFQVTSRDDTKANRVSRKFAFSYDNTVAGDRQKSVVDVSKLFDRFE